MNPPPRLAKITSLLVIFSLTTVLGGICLGQTGRAAGEDTPDETEFAQRVAEDTTEERREFQLPELIPISNMPDLNVAIPNLSSPKVPAVLLEHKSEILRLANDAMVRTVMGNEEGAVLVAGLTEIESPGRPARYIESTTVRNDDFNLALKLKLLKLQSKVRSLQPPRRLALAAPMLREGSPDQAGVVADAKAKIDALCREWAEDSGEPFVTLVARRGVIITHEAFGKDCEGQPVGHDYRCWVASIRAVQKCRHSKTA